MASKEHILDIACRLFRERGCKSVTMDDIATESGISKRTLYEQFDDKSALLRDCTAMMGERYGAQIERIRQNSGNVLEFFFNVHRYQTDFRMKMYDNFFSDMEKYYPEVFEGVVSKINTHNYEKNRGLILQGQSQGIFNTFVDVDILTALMTDIVNVIKESKLVGQYEISRRELLEDTMFIFLRGVSTPKGIEMIDEYVKSVENKDKR